MFQHYHPYDIYIPDGTEKLIVGTLPPPRFSKNGPEYLFRKQLKKYGLQLECIQEDIPRAHKVIWNNHRILTISLTSPSSAANRAIGSNKLYKERKLEDPSYTVFQFRLEQYRTVFCSLSQLHNNDTVIEYYSS